MGNDILKYKEFWTKINYSIEDNLFYGKIENIHDLVNFHGKNKKEIKQSFENAVNDYIQICKELNKKITFKNYPTHNHELMKIKNINIKN